jgi:hypothetical protein
MKKRPAQQQWNSSPVNTAAHCATSRCVSVKESLGYLISAEFLQGCHLWQVLLLPNNCTWEKALPAHMHSTPCLLLLLLKG